MSGDALEAGGAWPERVARLVLPEVESTNAEALRRAPGLKGPLWILALRQTAGRGRRGRAWTDPEGNFAATLVMRPEGTAREAALRSFIAALAVFDTVAAVTGRPGQLSLKWPNDLLLNGGKLAGILLESSGAGRRVDHLAIGIGVNLLSAPEPAEGALRPVSLMGETGIRIGPEAFLDLLAPGLAEWEGRFTEHGFDDVREAWLARAARLGETVIARTGTETINGTFETLDRDGALVLRTARGRRAISAADVFFT